MIRTSILTAVLLFTPALHADTKPRAWSPAERSIIDTLRLLRNKERPSNEELSERMLPWSSRHLDLLFEILEERRVPALDEGRPQTLSIYQEDLILRTVDRMERSRVVAFLRKKESAIEGAPSLDCRRAAIDFFGAAGLARDLTTIFRMALLEGETDLPRELAASLRRAVSTILVEDDGFRQVLPANGRLPQGFIRAIASAVGDTGDPRGLPFLSEALDWNSGLTHEILSQVRKVGLGADEGVNEELRAKVRGLLGDSDLVVVRTACLATAALDDVEALPALIELLESEAGGTAANAHWALQRITRTTLAASHDNWQRWFAAEKEWMARRKLLAFARLASPEPGDVTRGIAEVARHPMAREDFCEALHGLIGSRLPQIRILVIEQLAELGYARSRPLVEAACRDGVAEVAEAARAALERFRG